MTEQEKRRAIQEFFTVPEPFLHPPTLVLAGCVSFLGLLSAVSGDQVVVGLALLGAGVCWALFLPVRRRSRAGEAANESRYIGLLRYSEARERFRRRVSPDQVNGWLLEDLWRLEERSKEHLGPYESTHDPICVAGPLYSEKVDGIDPDLVLRRRVPGGFLYSTFRISIFHFSDTLLASFQVNFNSIQHFVAGEQTGEYFYKDVVSVRTLTESSNRTLKSGEKLLQSRTFVLSLSNGDRVAVVLDDPALQAGDRLRSLGDAAVKNIRAMLRDYQQPASPRV